MRRSEATCTETRNIFFWPKKTSSKLFTSRDKHVGIRMNMTNLNIYIFFFLLLITTQRNELKLEFEFDSNITIMVFKWYDQNLIS